MPWRRRAAAPFAALAAAAAPAGARKTKPIPGGKTRGKPEVVLGKIDQWNCAAVEQPRGRGGAAHCGDGVAAECDG
eukprot:gene4006-6798_t